MITKHDLDEAIAECQGQRNPTATTCLRLAAYYTVKNELFGKGMKEEPMMSYAPPPQESVPLFDSTSDFTNAVSGKNVADVMAIMDELMETMKVLQPRIYDSVMRKVNNI